MKQIKPINFENWLPDRCMPVDHPLDPETIKPEAGCSSLCGFYTRGSRRKLVALYRDVLDRFGCCGFVAWNGNRVVGYNNFFPYKVAREIKFYGWGEENHQATGTLVHHCISILGDAKYRRKHIGTNLIKHSLDWAKQNGWKRFEVHQVLPDHPLGFQSEQKSCQTFWSKFGFEVFRTEPACEKTREIYSVEIRHSMVLELENW